MKPDSLEVNARSYRWMSRPVVVVCVDGCEPAYLDAAIAAGVALRTSSACARPEQTWLAELRGALLHQPVQLVHRHRRPTGRVRICGNYFFDRELGQEVMRNDPRYLRAGTCSQPSPMQAPRSRWSPPRTSCASCWATA